MRTPAAVVYTFVAMLLDRRHCLQRQVREIGCAELAISE
jgi:hypothetical protein